MEQTELYKDMINALRETEEFPRNTYVCVLEDVDAFYRLSEELVQEPGGFLEEYLENHMDKAIPLISLGDLIDEAVNQEITLYIPFLETEDDHMNWKKFFIIEN